MDQKKTHKQLITEKGGDLLRKTLLKMKRMMKSRKAVSPVIAVILLIAIAVAASVTVFAYTQGILGGVTQANIRMSGATATNQASDVETATGTGNDSGGDGNPEHVLIFTIQNTGGQEATVDYMEVQDDDETWDSTTTDSTGWIAIYNAGTGELIKSGSASSFSLTVGAGESVQLRCILDGDPGSGDDNLSAPISVTINTEAGDSVSASFNVP